MNATIYHSQVEGLKRYMRETFRITSIRSISHPNQLRGENMMALFIYFTPAFDKAAVPRDIIDEACRQGMIIIHIDEMFSRHEYERRRQRERRHR